MSARTLTNVVNDKTVALNALIYGYAGHSLVTPQHALQQVWWTEERINERVSADFITSRLRPNERERVNRPVAFGDLTDDTYIEWILEKARRLFLVLAEIGEADRIFAVVDKSWDDDDLPLQMEDIEQLSLSNRRDNQANARFYHTQFTFLLRELREGVHVDYAPNEEVPLEYVMGLPPAVNLQHWSRVHLPKRPNEVYVRRKFPLGTPEVAHAFEEDYIMDVESARMVEHEHIAPVWASYTADGAGYTLTNFVGQHTLRTFIDHRNPPQYQRVPKPDRRWLLLNWLHCLSDAISTLHQSGFCHSNIRPSNILIDEHNRIAFSDIGSLDTFQKDKKPDAMDAYVYCAPEAHTSPDAVPPNGSAAPPPAINATRKPSIGSKSSSGSSNSQGSQRQKLTKAPAANDFSGFNFGFKKTAKPTPKPRSRVLETEKADVFSLGCVLLDIVTFMLKKKPHEFVKHRSSKQKVNAGGKNSRTDSSFHANLDKIETWFKIIEDASFEHDEDAFRAVPHILNLIRRMLSRAPDVRPSARDVRDRLLEIIINYTSIPYVHCAEHKYDIGVARSSNGSDRTESVTSLRTLSTMSSERSDGDTIRYSLSSNISTPSRASTISSASTASTTSLASSTSTTSTRVNAIVNSYSDRLERTTLLSEISESDDDGDDTSSIRTIEAPATSFADKSYESPRQAPAPPSSPPLSPGASTWSSSTKTERPSSSSSVAPTFKVKPWNKPFLLLP